MFGLIIHMYCLLKSEFSGMLKMSLPLLKKCYLTGKSLVTSKAMRYEMLKHLYYSHIDVVKTQLKAKYVMYWSNINSHIQDFESKYESCNIYSKNYQKEPLMLHTRPKITLGENWCIPVSTCIIIIY